ncbi:hypothetical protein LTR36_005726 [Oleoguttula mirabilis]|uniref:Uncharacterized protein n=1 Tax=Oleoguttula mirabilis TaxID=1507867 RepID=A0AAV9JDV4_9PEZI|nr:hypothetical protein LTR36_005726 [Oleoguttula mirabilis]
MSSRYGALARELRSEALFLTFVDHATTSVADHEVKSPRRTGPRAPLKGHLLKQHTIQIDSSSDDRTVDRRLANGASNKQVTGPMKGTDAELDRQQNPIRGFPALR